MVKHRTLVYKVSHQVRQASKSSEHSLHYLKEECQLMLEARLGVVLTCICI